MSQNVLEDYDAFGGEAGAPVPSWDTLGKGATQAGVILPQIHPTNGLVVSYLTTQQTSMATEEKPSELLWFDNDENGPTYHKRPRTQAEYLVQTLIRDFSDCSERFKDYAQKNDVEDDGIRRFIVKGKTGSQSMMRSGRIQFGGKGIPPVGARIAYTLVDVKKDPKTSFKTNITDCSFAKPDAESLRIVQEYAAENLPSGNFSGDSDAFSGAPTTAGSPAAKAFAGGATEQSDEPPF